MSDEKDSKDEDSLVDKIKKLKKKDGKKAPSTAGRHDKYQKEIVELKEAASEAQEKAMRAMAELQNAQRRMEQEKANFAAYATQGLMLQVLEIYENYRRLLEHEPEGLDEEWKKGFELIEQQFRQLMEQQGVTEIETKVGDKIDPEKHEAMLTGEGEEGVILEVFSAGYEMRERVLKAAKVKVGKG